MERRRQPLDPETQREVAELHRELGERGAREALGNLHPEAYCRALAGLSIQSGTRHVIATALQARKAGEAA